MKIHLFILTILAVLLLKTQGFAQKFPDTSLVRFHEVTFVSSFEEKVFNDLLNNKSPDFFDIFLCSDSMITGDKAKAYKSNFTEIVDKFKTDYYLQLAEKKKIQKIYAAIHEEMLGKYIPLVPFSSIFTCKEYHCVSSSMLYVLVFEELNIPYQIRTVPGHVYLVAYPSSSYIVVETTDPLHGTLIFDQTFKAKYIEYLRDSKLISKEEYYRSSLDSLFNAHFYQSQVIDQKGLASIQYINQFYSNFEELHYHDALENQRKAWLLNPDTTNTYLLLLSLLTDYTQLDKAKPECARQLGVLTRFAGKGMTADEVIGEFAQITQKQLLYEGDTELYDSSYQIVISNISDTSLNKEINFLYNYERGRNLCSNLDFENAIPYTLMAFELKPRNIDAKNNFILSLTHSLETKSPEEQFDLVNRIADEVPVLLEDNLFAQLRLSMYLMMMDNSFYEKDAIKGEEYRKQFETFYPQRNSKFLYMEEEISRAYGTASSYYFRLGRNDKTRAILEKGLEYAPNDYNLKNRLNAVK